MLTLFKQSLKENIPLLKGQKDRRDYGQDIRLWNDRDPRVDQSFFQASVPGFVLGIDQNIVDWNIGFELVFGHIEGFKRGMPVSKWYESIDNFRRLPNREEKLQGDAVVPFTDRERVVFVNPVYGRMVFTKLMSPVLDRLSGRIIGWNIALNINSVHERLAFFTALNDKIQYESRQARFVIGFDQIAQKSSVFHDLVHQVVLNLESPRHVLILGSLSARLFVEELFAVNSDSRVTIIDDQTEGLRHLKHSLKQYGRRVRIVRRSPFELSDMPKGRFDAAVRLWPKAHDHFNDAFLRKSLTHALGLDAPISRVSWSDHDGQSRFVEALKRDLELRGEVDQIRWHLGLVTECLRAIQFESITPLGLDQITEAVPGVIID